MKKKRVYCYISVATALSRNRWVQTERHKNRDKDRHKDGDKDGDKDRHKDGDKDRHKDRNNLPT